MEFFSGEALIFTKFFVGRLIFFRGRNHNLLTSAGVNAILLNFQG